MSLTYPGLYARHPKMSTRERAKAARLAQACLDHLAAGRTVPIGDVHWLYDHTGYPRYTKSAKFMADRIVETYKLDLITDRLTS